MRLLTRALLVLGSVAMLPGLLAGLVNHELVDTDRFVAHADAVRADPDVSRELAVRVTDSVLTEAPDLVAARPLLEGTAQAMITSSAFATVFRGALAPLHRLLVAGSPDEIVLRLADVGALLVAAARTLSPQAASTIPEGLDVRLASFGADGPGGEVVRRAHQVATLGWLLPALALLCFAAAVVCHPSGRRAGVRGAGIGLAIVGLGLAVATTVAGPLVDRLAPESLVGALAKAGWHELAGPLRLSAVLVGLAGLVLVVAARVTGRGQLSPASLRAWLTSPREVSPSGALGRAALVGALGVVATLEPLGTLALLVSLIGACLVAYAAWGALATLPLLLSGAGRRAPAVLSRIGRAWASPATAGVAVAAAVLVGVVVWNSQSSSGGIAAALQPSRACNGAVVLCERRYDEVAFPATHNSMSAADQAGWFLAEQPDGIIAQLDAGIRVFLIDTWYGQPTSRAGVIANSDDAYAKAFEQAKAEYGPEILDSALRLRDVLRLTPTGDRDAYLCHALCVLGSTAWEPVMAQVRAWLADHPREVVTFFIQDELTAATTADVVARAGLLPYVYTPTAGEPWPTLGEMIDSGHRLVMLAEHVGGGDEVPWLLQGFDWVQDTPYDATDISQLSCRANRGPADASLFLVNHWVNQPLSRVSSSRRANSSAVLGEHLRACQAERGRLPNYVAVDYYDQGDLFAEVDRLNGLR